MFDIYGKLIYYFFDLKPFICKATSENLRCMPSKLHSTLIVIRLIAVGKGRSKHTLMEHARPRRPIITITSKNDLPSFILCDTPDSPSSGLPLYMEQGPENHLHPTETMGVVPKPEKYCSWNQYLFQLIYLSHYNSNICWIARGFIISNKSLQCLKISCIKPCTLS